MKIAFVVAEFPVISQTFIVNQITDLLEKGHEVKVISLNRPNGEIIHQKVKEYELVQKTVFPPKEFSNFIIIKFFIFLLTRYKGIKLIRVFKRFKFFSYQQKGFDADFFSKNKFLLEDQDFDIVHAHFGPVGLHVAELYSMGFFRKAKFITTFHGFDLNPGFLEDLKKKYHKLFREVDVMTVNTPYSKSLLQKITDRKEIEVLPVGLDTNHFRKKECDKNKYFKILFVGRLIELKAPDLAIEILKILLARGYHNVRLEIIGEGELMTHLSSLINKYELQQHVNLAGGLSQEEVIKKMERADILLMPGIYDREGRAETQGLVIQEAQAMELPVIISNAGGMKFGVIEGETGFIVKEKDLEGFANSIEVLINNEGLKKIMGAKGRDFVVENFDSSLLGKKLEEIYSKMLYSLEVRSEIGKV